MLRTLGRIFYAMSLGSIILSLGTQWRMKNSVSKSRWMMWRKMPIDAQSERISIFYGLWAPTFAIMGKILEDMSREVELREGLSMASTGGGMANSFNQSSDQRSKATSGQGL